MKRQRLISELIQILYQADCPMNKCELYSDLSFLGQIESKEQSSDNLGE